MYTIIGQTLESDTYIRTYIDLVANNQNMSEWKEWNENVIFWRRHSSLNRKSFPVAEGIRVYVLPVYDRERDVGDIISSFVVIIC